VSEIFLPKLLTSANYSSSHDW